MTDEIASRLKKVRKVYGLSQRELAKRAGVTNSSISMIEQGRVSPSLSSLEKLLKGIPMKLKDFFSIDLMIILIASFALRNYRLLLKAKLIIIAFLKIRMPIKAN